MNSPYVLDPTGRDIHGQGAHLRAQGPAALIELPGGVRAWSVNSYAHIKMILADPRISKDPRRHWPAFVNGEIDMDWPLITWVMMDNMTTAFGQDHLRLRRMISKTFTARRVEAMRPRIEKIVAKLLTDLVDVPPGELIDLKARFAYPLPATMICELFGVPEEGRADILRGGEQTTDSNLTPEEAAANFAHWQAALSQFIQSKRQNPGDDMATDLIAVRDDDDMLTDSELVGTVFLVLGAGSETVMNLISHAIVALLSHRDQFELVRSGAVSWADVIEETLRWQGPIAQLPIRFAIEDIDFDGVRIAKGDPILIGFAHAGRDPQLHGATAEDFDVTRASKENLAFGHGAHFCLGAPLARMETEIALTALFDRFPDISLAADPADMPSQGTFIMNGYREVPVYLHGR